MGRTSWSPPKGARPTGVTTSGGLGLGKHRNALDYWHLGFGVSSTGVVLFQRKKTRDQVMSISAGLGFVVEPVDTNDGFGFRPVDEFRPRGGKKK